jgi:hypothetical protein
MKAVIKNPCGKRTKRNPSIRRKRSASMGGGSFKKWKISSELDRFADSIREEIEHLESGYNPSFDVSFNKKDLPLLKELVNKLK